MCAAPRSLALVRRLSPALLGCGFLAAAVAYPLFEGGSGVTLVLEMAVPVVVGLALIAYAGAAFDREDGGHHAATVTTACVICIALVALANFWSIYLHTLRRGYQGQVVQQTLVAMSTGAGAGAVIGHYYGRLTAQLRENESLQRAIASSMDGVAIVESGHYVYANGAYADLYDFDGASAVVGTDCHRTIAPDDRARFDAEVKPVLESRGRWRGRLTGRRLDGTTFPQELSVTAVDGGFVLVARDVTDRRDREQRIQVLNRVLRHNLRNAFTVIQGHARLLAERDHPDVEEHHLEPIRAEAESLLAIADKARRAERTLEHDPGVNRIGAATVAERIEDAADDYPTARIDVTIENDVSLPAAVVDAIYELIDNAVEHDDGDGSTVAVTLRSVEREGGRRAEVAVRDDGPGIPVAEREALQEGRETQLDHGSGLGLWLVKWTVTAAGGRLTFEDREPRGSVVRCSFPAADGADSAGPVGSDDAIDLDDAAESGRAVADGS